MVMQKSGSSPSVPQWLNVALRALMEAGIVAGLAYWGWQTGGEGLGRVALGLGAPVLGFGIWGALDFRWMGELAEPLRLMEELAISGLAALALYSAGQPGPAWALAALSVFHHGLVYLLGDRLIRR